MCLSQTPIASQRKSSKTIPNCVLAKFQSHLIESILRQFQIVSQPISIASQPKYSNTISNCVLAKFQSHFIENILGISILCLSQSTIAS